MKRKSQKQREKGIKTVWIYYERYKAPEEVSSDPSGK